MTSHVSCQSCGMPIESGLYCRHCTDENGRLQSFEVRFARMVEWILRGDPSLERAEAEARTRDAMRRMPAWKDHPRLAE